VRGALERTPCLIAFSGGRDSSALLAVAVDLARREGLSLPVPVTLRFASTATHEAEWQELVVRHLGLEDWVRLDYGAELDMVGPIAADGLRRHGLLYPANAHLIVPMAQAAAGGSILTGLGGDDVFGNWPWHDVASTLARRRSMRPRDLQRYVRLGGPRWLDAEILRRREPLTFPWIASAHRRRVARALALLAMAQLTQGGDLGLRQAYGTGDERRVPGLADQIGQPRAQPRVISTRNMSPSSISGDSTDDIV